MTDDEQITQPDEVWTPEELAAHLRIGRTTAYGLLSRQVIDSFRIGRRLIMRSAIERFLAERSESRE
jgi:excisionase family DNA binding protein